MKRRNSSNVQVTDVSGRTGRELLTERADTSLSVRALTCSAETRESLLGADEDSAVTPSHV